MEAPETIEPEIITPNKKNINIDFIEELKVKNKKGNYKIQFGIIQNQNELVIRVALEQSEDLFYYQHFYTLFEIKKLSKAFTIFETVKDLIIFLKTLNFEIEEKNDYVNIKFFIYMIDGQNKLIQLSLEKNVQDKNHIIKYFLEEIKAYKKDMSNLGEIMKQEISTLKKNNLKYENDIKLLKENNSSMNKEISSLKDHIMNLNENIQNNIQTITKLNEDNKCFRTIIFILFILLVVFAFIYYYRIYNIKNSLSNNIENNIKNILAIEKIKGSFNSKIIDSIYSINFIFYKIRENDKSLNFNNIKLLYRASRDGDSTKTCHKLCDNKQNVLIIIKSDIGYIFGGYSKIGFKTSKNWGAEKDNNSFLFSLDLKRIYPAIKDKYSVEIYDETYGLCFTGSLIIHDNFLKNYYNYLGNNIKEHFNDLEDKYEMNGGKDFFKIKELEVFQLF